MKMCVNKYLLTTYIFQNLETEGRFYMYQMF